ncbi:MAG: hypothetical protein RLN69_15555 [Woeseiaceae bacterium]
MMFQVEPCELPQEALLRRYSDSHDGVRSYTDCFAVRLTEVVSLQQFVQAFYTTPLFRVERTILGLIGRPSSDEQALSLSQGNADSFAAWSVEARSADQLLMCDFRERTRSWFMVADNERSSTTGTQLFFGSAVVSADRGRVGKSDMGQGFRLLLGFHRWYSKALLESASAALKRTRKQ